MVTSAVSVGTVVVTPWGTYEPPTAVRARGGVDAGASGPVKICARGVPQFTL